MEEVMRKSTLVALVVMVIAAVILPACGGTAAPAAACKAGLVTDVGKINDGTFNQYAFDGLKKAETDLGIGIKYIETQAQTDYGKNIQSLVEANCEIIVAVGFMMGDAVAEASGKYPETKFAIVDFAYDPALPNVRGLVFAEDQAGYMAGALAASMSQSGTIVAVGGMEIRARGAEAAKSFMSEGADVIFGAGGQTGSGGIQAAAEAGIYVIGVDQDEYVTTFQNGAAPGSDKIISSAMKRVDQAVFLTIKDVVDGKFTNGVAVYDASNGGIGLASYNKADAAIPADVKAKMDEILKGLADGSITTGVTLN